jgi:hypothetical protein
MSTHDLADRVSQLLADIDTGSESRARESFLELTSAGVAALEFVMQSLDEINAKLLQQDDVDSNLERLRRRVEILATMRDERVVMPILRALVDSSMAVIHLTEQQLQIQREVDRECQARGRMGLEAGTRLDLEMGAARVERRLAIAHWLVSASVRALVGLGELSLPHVERSLPRAPLQVQHQLRVVRARILRHWWKFWLWF